MRKGTKASRVRPEADWHIRQDEALRLIPEDLWQAAQAALAQRRMIYVRAHELRPATRQADAP